MGRTLTATWKDGLETSQAPDEGPTGGFGADEARWLCWETGV